MKKFYLILICLAGAAGFAEAQQNIQFSQYVFNGLSVNPAYAGYKEAWYAQLMYRSQWTNLEGAPRSGLLSVDGLTSNPDKKVGLGLQVSTDQLGPQDALAAYGSFAYRLQLNEADTRRLAFGLGWGFTQYSLDGNALRVEEGFDPAIPPGKMSTWTPDLRFGVFYYGPRFYAGASVMDMFSSFTARSYHLNGRYYGTIRKSRHYYLTAGMLFNLSERVLFKPSFLLKEDFNSPGSLDLNASFLLNKRLWLGAAWRTAIAGGEEENELRDAGVLAGIAEFYISDRFRIGYSFDYTLGELGNYENGSHEISMGFIFPSRQHARNINYKYF